MRDMDRSMLRLGAVMAAPLALSTQVFARALMESSTGTSCAGLAGESIAFGRFKTGSASGLR
jgi:hypothetical protein